MPNFFADSTFSATSSKKTVLFGSALMFVPVIGHIVVLGPLAATIASDLQDAVQGGGLSVVFGALSALGIPKDSVLRYETALKANKFLVILHAGADAIRRAHKLLAAAGGTDVQARAGTQ